MINWRFMSEYYDGPLSGLIAVPNGEFIAGTPVFILYWAECFEETDELWDGEGEPAWYRRYKVWELTAASMNERLKRIARFEELVGKHWSWDEQGNRGDLGIREGWHKFYDEEKGKPEWKPEGKIVGWFED